MVEQNVLWHPGEVTREERRQRLGTWGCTVWFTGLSASGKSTLASALEKVLIERGLRAYRLDGDNIRHGLNSDLGFTPEDRVENIRRIGEVARLFADAGALVVSAFISPYRKDRDRIRGLMGEGEFVEVFVDTPLEICEARDPKGLYKKARAGEISNFTGLDAPYEAPERPEVHLLTADVSLDEAAVQVIRYLEQQNILGES